MLQGGLSIQTQQVSHSPMLETVNGLQSATHLAKSCRRMCKKGSMHYLVHESEAALANFLLDLNTMKKSADWGVNWEHQQTFNEEPINIKYVIDDLEKSPFFTKNLGLSRFVSYTLLLGKTCPRVLSFRLGDYERHIHNGFLRHCRESAHSVDRFGF